MLSTLHCLRFIDCIERADFVVFFVSVSFNLAAKLYFVLLHTDENTASSVQLISVTPLTLFYYYY